MRFLVEVYAPASFGVVAKPSFLDAPRTFQNLVACLNSFPFSKEEKKKMEKCVNENCLYAHPEAMLLSLLTDLAHGVRMTAAKIINEIKRENRPLAHVRQFIPPEGKWQDITSYDLFITSFKGTLTEPPITMRLTQEEVLEVAEDPSKLRLTPDPTKLMREPSTEPGLETIPCHT